MSSAPPIDAFARWPASWYLFGRSSELDRGPVSKPMLGRRIVAFRGADGEIAVLDANCSHMGADLGQGTIVDGRLVCPFHGWCYGTDGRCVGIPGAASPPPPFAKQKRYPARERHGYLFFFFGEEALFPLPFFPGEDEADLVAGGSFRFVSDCTWFVNAAHVFDRQHFATAHGRRLLGPLEVDCPTPFARRNHYRAEILGRTPLDRLLRWTVGSWAEIELTVFGGTFVTVAGKFQRARSRFMVVTRPLEDGRTVSEGIVYAPRPSNRAALAVRRFFTRGYLDDEARRLRETRYDPSRFVEGDAEVVDFYRWLITLPTVERPVEAARGAMA